MEIISVGEKLGEYLVSLRRAMCEHLFTLFKYRKDWLDCAKCGSEITDGPNRAGRAVFQL